LDKVGDFQTYAEMKKASDKRTKDLGKYLESAYLNSSTSSVNSNRDKNNRVKSDGSLNRLGEEEEQILADTYDDNEPINIDLGGKEQHDQNSDEVKR
jgi:hypothetical protein